MQTETDITANGMKVALYGEIDHHNAKAIREEIDLNIKKYYCDNLVLDFKKVTFMDSSGIGLILGRYKLMKSISGDMKIHNPPAHIRRVFTLAGIERIIRIEYISEEKEIMEDRLENVK
jgi:stage II sporulation protein AA (anti-sigma F factor antagonist)